MPRSRRPLSLGIRRWPTDPKRAALAKDLPAETALSRALSKDLVKRRFRFVGPEICYAFMQSVGLVNDHIIGCFRRDLNESSGTN